MKIGLFAVGLPLTGWPEKIPHSELESLLRKDRVDFSVGDYELGWVPTLAGVILHRCCRHLNQQGARPAGSRPGVERSERWAQASKIHAWRHISPVDRLVNVQIKPFPASFATQAFNCFRKVAWSMSLPMRTSWFLRSPVQSLSSMEKRLPAK